MADSSDTSWHVPSSVTPKRRTNYFARHWHGDLSLPVAYWVNGVLGKVAVVFVSYAVPLLMIGNSESAVGSFVSLTVFIVSITAISIWQCVGIWRSANEHPKRGGHRFWAVAAQAMVIIGAFKMTLHMGRVIVPDWVQAAKMAINETRFGG